jgi:hypothetical protein
MDNWRHFTQAIFVAAFNDQPSGVLNRTSHSTIVLKLFTNDLQAVNNCLT